MHHQLGALRIDSSACVRQCKAAGCRFYVDAASCRIRNVVHKLALRLPAPRCVTHGSTNVSLAAYCRIAASGMGRQSWLLRSSGAPTPEKPTEAYSRAKGNL